MTARALRPAALPILALIAGVFWQYWGALAYSFSQDDYDFLARNWGLAPPMPGPWRWITHRAFYQITRGPFGLDPFPYHVTSLAIHAACSLLLYFFLRRRLRESSAWIGAFFFAAHPSSFTISYWISAHGDSLALLFAMAAILAWEARSAIRLLAVPLFALSLLSKESTLLLPLVLAAIRWASPRDSDRSWRGAACSLFRDPAWWGCVAVATASGLFFYLFFRAWVGQPPSTEDAAVSAYAFDLGTHVFRNGLTYLGWAANFFLPTVPGFSDAVDPRFFPWGIGAIALWVAGLYWLPRRREWTAAAATWLFLIAPVLALRHHTLHYYGYAAMIGIAWIAGSLFDQVLGGRPSPAPRPSSHRAKRARPGLLEEIRPVLATVICGLLVWNGRAVVKRIENAPLGQYGLRANSTVNRALVGQRIHDALRNANLAPHTNLYFWSPARHFVPVDPTLEETYWERNAKSATQNGLSVRLLFPQVDSVTFLLHPRPIPDRDRYVVYGVDGSAAVATWARVDSVNAMLPGAPSGGSAEESGPP